MPMHDSGVGTQALKHGLNAVGWEENRQDLLLALSSPTLLSLCISLLCDIIVPLMGSS